jgi:DNA-binding LacI/PurR family transcriptional regulator
LLYLEGFKASNYRSVMRSPPLKKKVTIHDIAAMTGVSYQTVSRVINGMPQVSPATRARIETVLSEVGFRPNQSARQLAGKRSTAIGIVTFATSYYGPSQILVNSEQAAKERGFCLMFRGIMDQNTRAICQAVAELCAHQVCGILIHLPWDIDLRNLQALCRDVPLVAVDSDLGFKCSSVFIRQESGSRRATRHLIELGHKNIAYLRGPMFWRTAQLRYAGWQNAVKDARLIPGIVLDGDWTAESGFNAAETLLSKHWGKFTGIVVANDQMALGAIRALEENSVRVPQDVSAIGFDDLPEAGFFRPPLSTVKQDFAALGRLSVEHLMAQINPESGTLPDAYIEPFVVTRQSSGPPVKRARAARPARR